MNILPTLKLQQFDRATIPFPVLNGNLEQRGRIFKTVKSRTKLIEVNEPIDFI